MPADINPSNTILNPDQPHLVFSDDKFLKSLSTKDLKITAENIRKEIIKSTSIYGGHLSSNLGVVEAVMALHREFNFPDDKLLFDVGHQAYTHKILTGRSLENLRQGGGISGFQKRSESLFDQFEAGHSSTSLSAALGMAIDRDLKAEKYEIVAFIGDASISNGEAFEALNHIGQLDHKIIIILNDNEMSITSPVGALSGMFRRWKISPKYRQSKNTYKRLLFKTRLGYFLYRISWYAKEFFVRHLFQKNIFEQMGFNYLGPIDGHSFKAMQRAFHQARQSNRSIVVHLKTEKGKGYSYSENDVKGNWHGVSPFNIASGKSSLRKSDTYTWSEIYAYLLQNLMHDMQDSILITPATIKGSGLETIFEKYRNRCFDTGIAEMHALGLAAGVALGGKFPVVSIYSTFMQRAFDQIIHDLARMRLPSLILVDRAGLIGADGETHQGIYDEAFLLNVPNIAVAMASSPLEAARLMLSAQTIALPFFIRYPRASAYPEKLISLKPIPVGSWIISQKGLKKDIALITFGPEIQKYKISALKDITIVNAIYQKPFDKKMIHRLLKYREIIIVDPYATVNGFCSILESEFHRQKFTGNILTRAIPVRFFTQDSVQGQMVTAGIDEKTIIRLIKGRIRYYAQQPTN